MAVAATNNQSILTAHMQPLVSGPMLYPGSLWQPVAAAPAAGTSAAVPLRVPVVAMPSEVPKESIIANTDFTTTSLIAKRRLSSKKRRLQHQTGSTGSEILTSENSSPSSSLNGSPAIASASCTPREKMDVSDPFCHEDSATTVSSASSQSKSSANPVSTTTTTSQPAATSNLIHSQVHNPAVMSQLQQGLNYRFLQEQSLLQQQQQLQQAMKGPPTSQVEHPQPHTVNPQRAPQRKSAQPCSNDFKWCVAHVITAKQIQQHKQQGAAGSPFCIYPKPHPQAPPPKTQSPPNHHHQHQHPPAAASSHASPSSRPSISSSSSHSSTITSAAPPMPHYTLMQYSIPPNHPVAVTAAPPSLPPGYLPPNHPVAVTAAATAAPSIPPGYLALPYSSLQELQLIQQNQAMAVAAAAPAHIQLNAGGIPVIGIGGGCGGMQMVGGVPIQQAQLAQLSLAHGIPPSAHAAAVVPSSMNPSVGGLPVVNSCIPFHTGVMAAPWVK